MILKRWIARNLAVALLGGVWTPRAAKARAEKVTGPASRRTRCRLVDEVFLEFPEAHRASRAVVAKFILKSPNFEQLNAVQVRKGRRVRAVLLPNAFAPASAFDGLAIPKITTLGDLADWLGISDSELEWFADERRQNANAPNPMLQHYNYRFIAKASGPPRLLEEPKPRLKAIQRRILHEILDHVPVHDKAHGFVKGRSVMTAAQIHCAEYVVISVDLKDFFLTTDLNAVHRVFRQLGYPWAVARALTGLCSASAPLELFDKLPVDRRHKLDVRRRFRSPHLPQGSPTSPALANLVARRLDARLQGLVTKFTANYTRYADDLTFSGEASFYRGRHQFLAAVFEIVESEGFNINPRKTRIMPRAQQQLVLGMVVNDGLNLARPSFDALKATLYNCSKAGWRTQNHAALGDYRAHLDGRIAWAETVNADRGRKLREAFSAIDWS